MLAILVAGITTLGCSESNSSQKRTNSEQKSTDNEESSPIVGPTDPSEGLDFQGLDFMPHILAISSFRKMDF